MTVWADPRSELQSITLRELSMRLWVETDREELAALVTQFTRIVDAQLRPSLQN
jgi:hypothetical protein